MGCISISLSLKYKLSLLFLSPFVQKDPLKSLRLKSCQHYTYVLQLYYS